MVFGNAQVSLFDGVNSYPLNSASASAGTNTAGSDGWINRILGAGTWYVSVNASSTASYNLDLSLGNYTVGTAASNSGGATLATARALGNLSTIPMVIADYLGANNVSDYYGFNVSSLSTISITVSGLSANVSGRLLNASGQQLAYFSGSSTSNGSLIIPEAPLPVGTYYLALDGSYTEPGSTCSSTPRL